MILELLITGALTILAGVMSLMPTYDPGLSIAGLAGNVGSYAGTLSGYVPVGTLGLCLAAIAGANLALLVWRVVVFVYDLIPFKAS